MSIDARYLMAGRTRSAINPERPTRDAGDPPRSGRAAHAGRPRPRASAAESSAKAAVIDEKRERILEVAERLFFEHGYANTTMDRIVAELGVTKPYVYYYFGNKLEIYETLCWRPSVACFTVLDFPADDARPAHEKIADGLERLIRLTIEHHPAAFFSYREPQVLRPEFAAAQRKLARYFYSRLCELLEQARADGTAEFENTMVCALAACSIPGFLYNWYRPDGPLSPDEMVRVLTAAALRVIGLRLTKRPGRRS